MFDFIKKKIKDSLNSIQKKLSKEEESEIKEDIKKESTILSEDREELKKDLGHEDKEGLKEEIKEVGKEVKELKKEEKEIKPEEKHEPRKKKVFSHVITDEDVTLIFSEIKSALLENNVALSVLDKIHDDLSANLVGESVSIINNKKAIEKAIKDSIADVLIGYSTEDFISKIKSKKPFVLLFIGVNGAGKTTTIAKLCKFLQSNGLKPVIAASDTFRAASIEQLEIHAKRLGVEVIKHTYGADPAAVAFDAIKHADSDKDDVVLIDTAGRSDINKNLIEELKKVKKVSKPDLTIFVGDSLTGNDVVKQAEIFDKEVGIDLNILSKADVDKKGGAVLSISYVTKKPILFLGTGQDYKDLVPFNKEKTASFILND
ncbi:MAG: signal recognition particle-docking protein FtsY [Candidatus Parvarchaeota archaeon]|jgi:fused signal recognition particle receptor|nr:signal recognition particle-docking protein FtsY [Candidatus Parvarchaeota archaeon]MCL5107148.1 signal recognition particle-docking protein FtsY [Candidatus Parvarchaeota archaeon]